jgi:hypothetical protein
MLHAREEGIGFVTLAEKQADECVAGGYDGCEGGCVL